MNVNKYNGWTNYETWAVKLWIDNDEGSQTYWEGRAQECWDDAEAEPDSEVLTRAYNAALALAEELKTEFDDGVPDGSVGGTVYGDLLNAALSEVNWHEIAENMLEEISKDEATA